MPRRNSVFSLPPAELNTCVGGCSIRADEPIAKPKAKNVISIF